MQAIHVPQVKHVCLPLTQCLLTWWELNLANCPESPRTKINIGGLKFGGSARYIAIRM